MQLFNITWSRTFFQDGSWTMISILDTFIFTISYWLSATPVWLPGLFSYIQKRLSLTENSGLCLSTRQQHEAEFKEFEQWLKNLRRGSTFGWFHLNVYLMFQDLSRCSIETSFWRIWDSEQVVYYWYIQTLTGKAEQHTKRMISF